MPVARDAGTHFGRSRGPRVPVNGWIHLVGAVLAVAGLVWLLIEVRGRSPRHLIGAIAFAGTAILMFSASALYHLRGAWRHEAVLQRLDHAMIYLFIAGSYTPICLVALWTSTTGPVLLAIVWLLAALGLYLDVRTRPLHRGQATALYLAMGWTALALVPSLRPYPRLGIWLLVGGVFYTGGALLYWREWPRRRLGFIGFHELWHLCVLLASASHFWAIRTYVLTL